MTKILFTAEAVSTTGRSGTIESPDKLLNLTLGNPLEAGAEKRGPGPELLFAGAYAACYHGALVAAGQKSGHLTVNPVVRAQVSLNEETGGGFRLTVELHAHLPGIDRTEVMRLMAEAHQTCPYSKALRGDAGVTLVAD